MISPHHTTPRLRVASAPAGHRYVRNLGLAVDHLPDPVPPGAAPGQWWPPVMLRPEWIEANAHAFDLMHLHFGLETVSTSALSEALDALRRAGRPLVFTVHDLAHPQLSAPHAFRDHLDVLIPRADALTALTPGSARTVRRIWGRAPRVIGHPHMHPWSLPLPNRHPSRAVGMFLGDLRPNVDGPRAARALARAAADLPQTTARVWMRDRVRDEAARDAIRACAGIELIEAPAASDSQLTEQLTDLAAVVLPHSHGTHSGWIELLWDLGVPTVAPDVGHFAEQRPVETFRWEDPQSLSRALGRALRLPRADLQRRRAERRARQATIAALHLDVYRSVLGADRQRAVLSPLSAG